jgi:hypothetical protein
MTEPRCPRHDVTLEPDGRCLLCQEGAPAPSQLRQLMSMIAVLGVVVVVGIAYLASRPSDGDVAQLDAARVSRVPITIYMADW